MVNTEAVNWNKRRFDYWRRSVAACLRHRGERVWDAQLHRSFNQMFAAYRELAYYVSIAAK